MVGGTPFFSFYFFHRRGPAVCVCVFLYIYLGVVWRGFRVKSQRRACRALRYVRSALFLFVSWLSWLRVTPVESKKQKTRKKKVAIILFFVFTLLFFFFKAYIYISDSFYHH